MGMRQCYYPHLSENRIPVLKIADGKRVPRFKIPQSPSTSCGLYKILKPRVLFAGPTSNGSANVPVLSNLRTDPHLDSTVGYVRKPV